jgi:hypothetical protein
MIDGFSAPSALQNSSSALGTGAVAIWRSGLGQVWRAISAENVSGLSGV